MIDYTLKRSSRARALRLTVQVDGAVVVTAPDFFGVRAIERFVTQHSEWARRKVEESRGRTIVHIPRSDILVLKKRADSIVRDRCAHFAAVYGVTYGAISVRAQKTRWGSCSHAGNLSFNYKIAALSEDMIDYVVVHEICHLIHFNHSKEFWHAVAQTIPNHKAIRARIRSLAFVFR